MSCIGQLAPETDLRCVGPECWDEVGGEIPCSSYGVLGKGAAPSSGVVRGDSSFRNNVVCENG